MTHPYLSYSSFSLQIDALTDLHIGNGEVVFRRNDEETVGVHEQVKDANGRAWLPGASLKGGYRSICSEELAYKLFGGPTLDFIETTEVPITAGTLVPMGATLQESTVTFNGKMVDRNAGTYVRTRHARNRDTLTVDKGRLFHVEVVPAGSRFLTSFKYFDYLDQEHESLRQFLDCLMGADGLTIGGHKTTMGKVRFTCKDNSILSRAYVERSFVGNTAYLSRAIRVLPPEITPNEPENLVINLCAPGPLMIDSKQWRPKSRTTPKNASTQSLDDVETKVSLPLRGGGQDKLTAWSEALRQSLRTLAAYLEATQNANSSQFQDDPFVPFNNIEYLTSTQRLFGVEGLKGFISLHVTDASFANHQELCEMAGIELDVWTSGNLSGVTFFRDTPVGGDFKVTIGLDRARYAIAISGLQCSQKLQKLDETLLIRLNSRVRKVGLKAGSKVSRGFGWFEPFDPGLTLDVQQAKEPSSG